MKSYISLFILFLISALLHAQSDSTRNDDYYYAWTKTIDSVYACDTLRLTTNYYAYAIWQGDDMIEVKDMRSIKSQGEYTKYGKEWHQSGYWKYWDESRQPQLEVYYGIRREEDRYINQWTPDGTKVLDNGWGIYYTAILPHYWNEKDSIVYEIKDSLKHGKCKRYMLNDSLGSRKLVEEAQFIHNRKNGFSVLYYENGNLKRIEKLMINDTTLTNEYYMNGTLAESGLMVSWRKHGHWMYWSQSGELLEEKWYLMGKEIGEYKAYHKNGRLSLLGQYVHIAGELKIMAEDEDGELVPGTIKSDHIPAKDGVWKYFDESGKLIKEETYHKEPIEEM